MCELTLIVEYRSPSDRRCRIAVLHRYCMTNSNNAVLRVSGLFAVDLMDDAPNDVRFDSYVVKELVCDARRRP